MRHFSWQFWMLCLSTLFFFTSFNLIIPELSSYLEQLGSKNKAWIISSFAFVALICRPFSGVLTDKIGRLPIMILGAGIACVASLSYPLAVMASSFIAIRLFHGFSAGFKPTATVAYVSDIVPQKKRGEAMGFVGLMNNIGFMIGVGFGSLIKNKFGFEVLFGVSAFFALASILVVLGMKETLANKQAFQFKHLRIKFSEILSLEVAKPAIIMFFGVIPFGCLLTLIPDYSQKIFQLENKGVFFIYMTCSTLITRIVAGKLSDKFGRIPIILVGTMFWIVGLLLLSFTHTLNLFFLSALVLGVASGFNSPSIFAWAIDLASPKTRGRSMSTLFIFLELGIIIGSILPTILVGGNPIDTQNGFKFCLATSIMMLWILIYFKQTEKK